MIGRKYIAPTGQMADTRLVLTDDQLQSMAQNWFLILTKSGMSKSGYLEALNSFLTWMARSPQNRAAFLKVETRITTFLREIRELSESLTKAENNEPDHM